ncbi:hypothetical protein [Actinomycetospora flava]|uniref:Uncharacterized protein n=1 Tax=Actinomycetospora flava TaxID=3129232 RepID=A0ABU8M9T4_9PSEU
MEHPGPDGAAEQDTDHSLDDEAARRSVERARHAAERARRAVEVAEEKQRRARRAVARRREHPTEIGARERPANP